MSLLLGFIEGLGSPVHWLLLCLIGILFFGKRLPETMRSLGKSIQEFKKGYRGLEDEMDGGGMNPMAGRPESPALEPPRPPQRVTTNVPKFEDNPNNITPP